MIKLIIARRKAGKEIEMECKNCGGEEAIHHWKTNQCPFGGADVPARQQVWVSTEFEEKEEVHAANYTYASVDLCVSRGEVDHYLNKMARGGWRFVAVEKTIYFFEKKAE